MYFFSKSQIETIWNFSWMRIEMHISKCNLSWFYILVEVLVLF